MNDFTFNTTVQAQPKRYKAFYEGSVEQGCSGMYIVVDMGEYGNDWIEVTGPMPYERANEYAARLNKR